MWKRNRLAIILITAAVLLVAIPFTILAVMTPVGATAEQKQEFLANVQGSSVPISGREAELIDAADSVCHTHLDYYSDVTELNDAVLLKLSHRGFTLRESRVLMSGARVSLCPDWMKLAS